MEAKREVEKARKELRRLELRFNPIEEETHWMEGGWERVDAIRNGTARPLIDMVLTRGAARSWAIPEYWDHSSDHVVVIPQPSHITPHLFG